MHIILISLSILFMAVHSTRTALAHIYIQKKKEYPAQSSETIPPEISILQPILSGDPNLETCLRKNIENAIETTNVHFVWLVDEDDTTAQPVASRIAEQHTGVDIEILYFEKAPENANPKVFKLAKALERTRLKEYFAVLDDDAVIDPKQLTLYISKYRNQDKVITGIPTYGYTTGLLGNLVAAFVNSNSVFIYFSMAFLSRPKTLNGMFYFGKTANLEDSDAFNRIQEKLCDDYEIARVYREYNRPVVQELIGCKVGTSIKDRRHYLQLMKRWMVFSNEYISRNLSIPLVLLTVLPNTLAPAIWVLALISGVKYLLICFSIFFLKALGSRLFLKHHGYTDIKGPSTISRVFLEMVVDLILPLHYLHALLSPKTIQWRDKTIKVDNHKII